MEMEERFDELLKNELPNRRFEGEAGVRNLSRVARLLGYKDPMYFGQFDGGSIGDLINFLEDNPGCQEAIINWMRENADCWEEFLPTDEECDEECDSE